MWDSIQQVASFLASIFILVVSLTGLYLWLRYGSIGMHFLVSKDFERACHDWQARRLEGKERAEVEARAYAEDRVGH